MSPNPTDNRAVKSMRNLKNKLLRPSHGVTHIFGPERGAQDAE